eukprot:scaffold410_cov125-Isochrysis_galbana.AAC.9
MSSALFRAGARQDAEAFPQDSVPVRNQTEGEGRRCGSGAFQGIGVTCRPVVVSARGGGIIAPNSRKRFPWPAE